MCLWPDDDSPRTTIPVGNVRSMLTRIWECASTHAIFAYMRKRLPGVVEKNVVLP
ncbi:hypothetical protein [Corynebacterium silvaticum]|uniref:Uncharacterized protein n=1 Tax=Corynebacterium silvaticum TaxID=2320431 RepID=A0ACD4PY85_9CORY|nr:hypothetical protein [Corynebacterium silvaticum]WCV10563.1 hypothetical protein CBE74_12715 [Corynebacterium silvaticum]